MRDFTLGLAHLGGALRARGIATTLRDELDAAEALTFVDLVDKEEVRRATRIALKIPRAGFETYDELFGTFWDGEPDVVPAPAPRRRLDAPALPRGRPLHWDPDAGRMSDSPGTDPSDGERPGYSPVALLRRKPFDETGWSGAELAAMERLLARLARRVATCRSRRLVPTRGRGRPDLRSSYRRALASAGEILVLARRTRAVTQSRLVFLLDTSGSMDAHGRFLMSFALSVRRAAPRAEVFAFNTELVHITASLAPGKVRLSLERLFTSVPDWSGGTRIGESLAAFAEGYLQRVADHKSIVVILSDGLDRGDPARLAEALRLIRRRARKVIWLNPLLGDPRYEPATLGMRVALPYVDHFASAHNLESLERLLPELTG
ncbi:MAG TPA: VWA domain-containing protein [Thermoanaerobaculia bacterium]|nr:VWA domain-containing protein [Thermoanaerobaculia bacterium]